MVNRGNSNDLDLQMQQFPASGYVLDRRLTHAGTIGVFQPVCFEPIMSGDKFETADSVKLQFEPLATKFAPDLAATIRRAYVPYRFVMRDWDKFFTPRNGKRALVDSMPMRSLKDDFDFAFGALEIPLSNFLGNQTQQGLQTFTQHIIARLTGLKLILQPYHLDDFVDRIITQIKQTGFLISSQYSILQQGITLFYMAIKPWFGSGSIFDSKKLPVITLSLVEYAFEDADRGFEFLRLYLENSCGGMNYNELDFRCYAAYWIEHLRQPLVENRDDYPDYHEWTSLPLDNNVWFWVITPKFDTWADDVYTTAHVDDIALHAYAMAGITSEQMPFDEVRDADAQSFHGLPYDDSTRLQGLRNPTQLNLQYLDENGVTQTSSIRVPNQLQNIKERDGVAYADDQAVAVLPLQSLKTTSMMQAYLKRNLYLAPDTYSARLYAQCGEKLPDIVAQMPVELPSQFYKVHTTETMSSLDTGTENGSVAGEKTAVMDMDLSGQGCNYKAQEYGVVLFVWSLKPDVYYNAGDARNFMSELFDLPLPVFSQQADELSRKYELMRQYPAGTTVESPDPCLASFGHHPYKHAWRSGVNELHGDWLDDVELKSCLYTREWKDYENIRLNAYFLHCNIASFPMFVDARPDTKKYTGFIDHSFHVERKLPPVVENL